MEDTEGNQLGSWRPTQEEIEEEMRQEWWDSLTDTEKIEFSLGEKSFFNAAVNTIFWQQIYFGFFDGRSQ